MEMEMRRRMHSTQAVHGSLGVHEAASAMPISAGDLSNGLQHVAGRNDLQELHQAEATLERYLHNKRAATGAGAQPGVQLGLAGAGGDAGGGLYR